jgi:hypothetical protein
VKTEAALNPYEPASSPPPIRHLEPYESKAVSLRLILPLAAAVELPTHRRTFAHMYDFAHRRYAAKRLPSALAKKLPLSKLEHFLIEKPSIFQCSLCGLSVAISE